ncbi:MAG: hypothetical protein GY779_06625, partial [Gammaproteobacteria bacterium]|nr:hypothetical protein [Gammaproteobacteria bacterium]
MNKSVPGYQIETELFSSIRTVIYRGHRKDDNTSVIIKALNTEHPSNNEISHFKHEFNITRKMDDQRVIHAYEQIKYADSLLLILEDIQ